MIEIKNLSKSFGKKLVLNNLNLTIKDNSIQSVALMVSKIKSLLNIEI